MFLDRPYDVHEFYSGGKRVAMVNEWHAIGAIPTIQFNTPTAHSKASDIGFN